MTDSFVNLLTAAKSGDSNAFDLLIFDFFESLTIHMQKQISPKWQGTIEAEDIVQEAIHLAFIDLPGFDGTTQAEFGGWIKQIARHRMLDTVKWHERVKRGGGKQKWNIDDPLEQIVQIVFADSDTPSRQAVRQERIEAMRFAIGGLSDKQRSAIEHVWINQKTAREAAEIMECTAEDVNSLIHRAKKKLRVLMVRPSLWLSQKN